MVNPGICRRCPHCESVDGVERTEDDGIISIASVICVLAGYDELVVGYSKVPDGCPYIVEHTVLQDKTQEMAEDWREEIEERKNEAGLQH